MGHHCIEMGYGKLLRDSRPYLAGGQTADGAAQATDQTTLIELRRGHKELRLALLPMDRFPNAKHFPMYRTTAIVGRVVRPEKDPTRVHRLRLDRYDDVDFDEMREAMQSMGLWQLNATVPARNPTL